jgi:hypothetical protein
MKPLSLLIHAVAIPVRASIQTLLQDLQQLHVVEEFFGVWRRRCESSKGDGPVLASKAIELLRAHGLSGFLVGRDTQTSSINVG